MSDNDAYRFPVSVKGIVVRDGAVILVKNRRQEWELPGGKLEPDESPERCVAREIEEELGLAARAEAMIDAWVYTITPGTLVLMLTYGCVETAARSVVLSDEHTEVGWFTLADVDALRMPDGYKTSIARWRSSGAGGDAPV